MSTLSTTKLKPKIYREYADSRGITKLDEAEVLATRRIYRVRPAAYDNRDFSPDTHLHYVEITRLSDGKKHSAFKSRGWRDTDSWAHPRFQLWEREQAFWRSEQVLRRCPGVKFDDSGFVVRSSTGAARAQ